MKGQKSQLEHFPFSFNEEKTSELSSKINAIFFLETTPHPAKSRPNLSSQVCYTTQAHNLH